MYPLLTLNDGTEIVHSRILMKNGKEYVKVYIEKAVEDGFNNIICYLPEHRWEDNNGFNENDIEKFKEIIKSASHLIMRFAAGGGFENAPNI